MTSYKYLDYLKYVEGNWNLKSHLDAVHAKPPKSDLYTEEIVKKTIQQTGCGGIIALISRVEADLNRTPNQKNRKAVEEYRLILKNLLQKKGILDEKGRIISPYLHLSIHGMSDRPGFDVEIGTYKGASCSENLRQWFVPRFSNHLKEQIPGVRIKKDFYFYGYPSLVHHRLGDPSSRYAGYGELFNTIQLEFSKSLREKKRAEIIKTVSDIILEFNNIKEFRKMG